MNHIVSDCIQRGRGLSSLLLNTASKENLLTLVQISRPNWPATAHSRAIRFLRSMPLRSSREFSSFCDYMDYLDKTLSKFNREHPVRAEIVVADEVTLARWEERWRRARQGLQIPSAVGTVVPESPLKQAA